MDGERLDEDEVDEGGLDVGEGEENGGGQDVGGGEEDGCWLDLGEVKRCINRMLKFICGHK